MLDKLAAIVLLSGVANFDGTTSCGMTAEAVIPDSRNCTFSMWARPTGIGDGGKGLYPRIFQWPGGYFHFFDSPQGSFGLTYGFTRPNDKPFFGVCQSVARSNEWVNVVCAVKHKPTGEGMLRLFVNGTLIPMTWSAQVAFENLPAVIKGGEGTIGNSSFGGERPFEGDIADVRFYDRVISKRELHELWQKDPDGKPMKRLEFPPYKDEMPIVDISRDEERQTVIAEGTPEIYQGHPTTILSDDKKRIFCVWTINHGGYAGPSAYSDNGGRSWTRIDDIMPESFATTHKNCPTLQRVTGPDGKVRFCVFSAKVKGGGGLAILMSEDQGKTWQDLPSAPHIHAGMPPTGYVDLKGGKGALFGQRFKDKDKARDRPTDDQEVWMAITEDGGKTWGPERAVAKAENKNLCEPFAIRSPDGKEIALLMRENRHDGRSMMCFSSDEGQTWTTPVDTCWGLTGDRHEGLVLQDGRLLICFRDQAHGSSTRGQYVGWVGTWDDLRNGRSGQYRIHLLLHDGGTLPFGWSGDTGYSGVEQLPDGTIVCTTYMRYRPGPCKHSVVCTRFKMSEIDQMASH